MKAKIKSIDDITMISNDEYGISKGMILYYTRIIPNCGIYDLLEMKVRTVTSTYFVGVEKDTRQAFLFSYKSIDKNVFKNRKDALEIIREKCRS